MTTNWMTSDEAKTKICPLIAHTAPAMERKCKGDECADWQIRKADGKPLKGKCGLTGAQRRGDVDT